MRLVQLQEDDVGKSAMPGMPLQAAATRQPNKTHQLIQVALGSECAAGLA
jgi:hypothetical protein